MREQTGDRIMLIGCGGSGKSTLAARLGSATGLPVIHLDKEYQPGMDQTEWLAMIDAFARGERWILDGNFGVPNMDGRMRRATCIIFLDFSRRLCLWRGLRRNIAQQFSRGQRADGCPAKPDWTFIRWVWRFPRVQRIAILEKLSAYSSKTVILRNPGDVEVFMARIRR